MNAIQITFPFYDCHWHPIPATLFLHSFAYFYCFFGKELLFVIMKMFYFDKGKIAPILPIFNEMYMDLVFPSVFFPLLFSSPLLSFYFFNPNLLSLKFLKMIIQTPFYPFTLLT